MKMTIGAYEMKRVLAERDRDYYSIEALEEINEMYGDESEFDPVGLCCEWTEYGEHGAALELDDLICDYSYLMDEDEEETIENLIKHLEEKTTVLELQNGNYLVYAF